MNASNSFRLISQWAAIKPVKGILLLLFFLTLGFDGFAQELNCNVVINSQRVPSIEKRRFEEMKRAIQDFLNLRRWTEDKFKNEERVNANFIITIDEAVTNTRFKATVQIQSSRPVFGTSYESIMLNYLDKDWEFEFQEGQPMDFNENGFVSQLTSLLGFYVYVVLGFDYDSFSKNGGLKYFQKAQAVANAAITGTPNIRGWQTNEGTQNRGTLLENLMHTQIVPFREGLYSYHRLGLDVMQSNPDAARPKVQEMLVKMQQAIQQRAFWLVINIYLDAKANEIINIFSEAPPSEKQAAYNILVQIDPTKADRYQKLIK